MVRLLIHLHRKGYGIAYRRPSVERYDPGQRILVVKVEEAQSQEVYLEPG
jgi:hypothetical protein